MSQTVGDRLALGGVKRIYGYPGDGINGVMGPFGRSSNGQWPEFIPIYGSGGFTNELFVDANGAYSGDGVVAPREGALFADLERRGIGLELKAAEAERYAA